MSDFFGLVVLFGFPCLTAAVMLGVFNWIGGNKEREP